MKQEFFIGCRATTALAVGVLLAGCTANSGTVGSTPFTQAAAQNDALNQRVDDLFLAEGATPDAYPSTRTDQVTYNGLIHGDIPSGTGSDVEFYADLELDVDFDSNAITGTVDNFRTDLVGFTAPTGDAGVVGSVTGVTSMLTFVAAGNLTGTDRDADVFVDADGGFIGASAQAASGTHETDFDWNSGPDDTLTSFSDGDWAAEQ